MLNSDTPPSVHRSVGNRTSATTWPATSNARHLTAPVLKSHPVMMAFSESVRREDGMREDSRSLVVQCVFAVQGGRFKLGRSFWRADAVRRGVLRCSHSPAA